MLKNVLTLFFFTRAYQRHSIGNLLKGNPSHEQLLDFWKFLGPAAKLPLLILARQRTQKCKKHFYDKQ